MSRVSKLLTDIRAELADPEKERWSDRRLLSLLSQAQTEIAHATRVLIARKAIPIIAGQSEYFIDDTADSLLRVLTPTGPVELLSHFEMDDYKPAWELDTGATVEKIVYDLLSPNRIIVYPTPVASSDATAYPFEAGNSIDFVGGERLGVVTSIGNYSLSAPLGAVTNIIEPGTETSFSSPFGVITSISESVGSLMLQYAKRPAELLNENSELELSESFRQAMLHLTVSMAFTADIDTKSDALANKHYQLYQVQLDRLKSNKAHNQVKGNNARTISRNIYAS